MAHIIRSPLVTSLGPSMAAVAILVVGCGPNHEAEARVLIESLSHIDEDTPAAARRPYVEELAGLRLESEEIDAVRQRCLEGHEALLAAELGSSEARELTASIEGLSAEQVPPDTRARLEQALARSNEAIPKAAELIPECQSDMADLRLRYAKRR